MKNIKEIDEKYRYDGKDLGVSCADGHTVFKVWSPLSEKIVLRLYPDGQSEMSESHEMVPDVRGTWKLMLPGILFGKYYDYEVWTNGTPTKTADPYAVGCNCNGSRSMVTDLRATDPAGFADDTAPPQGTEQIIYELHIKDFSYDKDSGVPEEFRGKYKAFTVKDTNGSYPTCMEHLKELGVTHVHLLPFYDYGSVDEAGDNRQFNWGYDPMNYNVPEGSYATDAEDGSIRIRECKEMIKALHENGIRVVMDVVYNHTYSEDSWLGRMVPGYYYRHNEDGSLSNGSACGNDIAAGRVMVDNYIVDSVMYWAKEYHIDGFRFDLMGLLTVELMNRIRLELDEAFGANEKLLYGEPWTAGESPMEEGTRAALKKNVHHLSEGVAMFNDYTRDVVKGHVFYEKEKGFVSGKPGLETDVLNAVTGWREGAKDFRPISCAQIINYVSAHDNFTLWDKLVLSMHPRKPLFNRKYKDVLKANKLAAFLCFTCQGHLFLQAGEEFGRSKLGDDNSFCSSPEINMLRWHQTVEFKELLDYYKGLIRLRKSLPGLCDKSASAAERITEKKIHQANVVSFCVDNRGSGAEWDELFVIYNGGKTDCEIALPKGNWVVLADAKEADCRRPLKDIDKNILAQAHGGMMLGRKAGLV